MSVLPIYVWCSLRASLRCPVLSLTNEDRAKLFFYVLHYCFCQVIRFSLFFVGIKNVFMTLSAYFWAYFLTFPHFLFCFPHMPIVQFVHDQFFCHLGHMQSAHYYYQSPRLRIAFYWSFLGTPSLRPDNYQGQFCRTPCAVHMCL